MIVLCIIKFLIVGATEFSAGNQLLWEFCKKNIISNDVYFWLISNDIFKIISIVSGVLLEINVITQ